MKTEKEILIAARKRIEDPAMWSQYKLAIGSDGRSCLMSDPDARVCAVGAIHAVAGDYGDASKVVQRLRRAIGGGATLAQVNAQGHEAALSLFDRAIAECE